jgi:hypothetical protein
MENQFDTSSAYRYRDIGCEVYHECLSCPLPKCKFDEAIGLQLSKSVEALLEELTLDYKYNIEDVLVAVPSVREYQVREAVTRGNSRRGEGRVDNLEPYRGVEWKLSSNGKNEEVVRRYDSGMAVVYRNSNGS